MKQTIAALLIFTLLSTACATATPPNNAQTKPTNIKEWVQTQNRARRNAMIGAFAGAVIGAASSRLTGEDPWKSAAAGALAGAMAGFAVGKHKDRIYAERDLAVRQAQYETAQGYVAKIEEVGFNPSQPKPGQTATLYVRTTIIGPDPNEKIAVTMFRGLKYGDDYIMGAGPNEFVVPRGGGIVESTMEVTFPDKTPQGTYRVEALIEDPKGRFPIALGSGAVYVVASVGRARVQGAVASR